MHIDKYISNSHPYKFLFVPAGTDLLKISFIGNDVNFFNDVKLLKSHDNLDPADKGRIGLGKEGIEKILSSISDNGYATITIGT